MNITINTAEPLSDLDTQILNLLLGGDVDPLEVMGVEPPEVEKPAKAEKKAAKPEPEPMAEPDDEPEVEDPGEDDEPDADEDLIGGDASDEDLLALAVKKATDMVADGGAAKVREALDAVGASRVRELNTDNVREFFLALETKDT